MSVEEIVRYVRQTPGNTNPSVVGSMVNAEMNETLKAAKEYTDSQRLAHEEKTVIAWDGNTEGKETIEHELFQYLYKISDEGIDVENIKSLMLYNEGFGRASEYIAKTSVYHEGSLQMLINDSGAPIVLSTKENLLFDEGLEIKKGTYFYGAQAPLALFVESITIETIHQIDPKFIPKTVVDFDELFPGVDWMEATTLAIQKGGQHVIYGNYVDTVLRQITIEPGETMLATFTVNNSKSTAPASYMMYKGKPYDICFSFMGHIVSGSNQFPAPVVSTRVMISHYFIVIFAEIAAQIPAET